MEINIKEILKSVGISILAIIAIILILTVIFYNKISLSKVVPRAEDYELTDEVRREVESENEEQTEVLTTYELDASELKHYEKAKEYNKGKRNPFAAADTTSNSNTDKDNSQGTGNGGSSSENFYDDDGTK